MLRTLHVIFCPIARFEPFPGTDFGSPVHTSRGTSHITFLRYFQHYKCRRSESQTR